MVGVAEGAVVLVEKTIWVRSTEDSATSDPSMPPLFCDVEWSLDYKGTTRLEKQLANLLWRATVFVEDKRLSSWSAENILCVDDAASVRQWPGNGNDFCAVVATGAKLGDVFWLEPPDEYIYGGYRLRSWKIIIQWTWKVWSNKNRSGDTLISSYRQEWSWRRTWNERLVHA